MYNMTECLTKISPCLDLNAMNDAEKPAFERIEDVAPAGASTDVFPRHASFGTKHTTYTQRTPKPQRNPGLVPTIHNPSASSATQHAPPHFNDHSFCLPPRHVFFDPDEKTEAFESASAPTRKRYVCGHPPLSSCVRSSSIRDSIRGALGCWRDGRRDGSIRECVASASGAPAPLAMAGRVVYAPFGEV